MHKRSRIRGQQTLNVMLAANTSWYLYNFRRGTILALISKGYSVTCMAPKDKYSAKLMALGIQYIPIPLEGESTSLIKELRVLLFITSELRRLRPFYVFNFTVKMNFYVGTVCRLLNIPYANNVSGLGTLFMHERLLFRLVRKVYGFAMRGADKVFFQNDEDRQLFHHKGLTGEQSIVTLPGSGIDTNDFTYTPLPVAQPLIFLMVARLIGDKGVREYVEATRIIRRNHPDVRCLLAGPGGVSNMTALSDDEIMHWQAEGAVEYVGEQADIKPWLQMCHVVVLPSYREGMPRVVLEAASMGRPAIVADVPGCRQSIVNGTTGWLCPPRNAESLSKLMAQVVLLPYTDLKRMSNAARMRAVEVFSEHLVINHYLACLEKR